jgi:hypothetical protein
LKLNLQICFSVLKLVYNETCQQTEQCDERQNTICEFSRGIGKCICTRETYWNGTHCGKYIKIKLSALIFFKYKTKQKIEKPQS